MSFYRLLNSFAEPGKLEKEEEEEEEEEETVCHAELLSTGNVCHLQPRRHRSSVHSKNYLTNMFAHIFVLESIPAPTWFLGNLSVPDHTIRSYNTIHTPENAP